MSNGNRPRPREHAGSRARENTRPWSTQPFDALTSAIRQLPVPLRRRHARKRRRVGRADPG